MSRASWSLIVCLCACSSASPSPVAIADAVPAAREIGADDRARVVRAENDARRALAERRWSDAEDAAGQALAIDPRSARARAVLGVALWQRAAQQTPPELDLLDRADGETLAAARIAPADPVVGLLRGTFLARSGHVSAAAAVGEDCLRLAPGDESAEHVELLAATAEWCYELGEERRAEPWLGLLAARRPDDSTTQFRLAANLLRVAERPEQAMAAAAAFARCADLAPGDDDARFAVAAAFVRAAELALTQQPKDEAAAARAFEQAATACSDAAKRFPTAAEPWYRAGVIAERRGDQATARTAYENALQRAAGHLPSLLNLAALLAASDAEVDRATARELWRRALAVDERSGGLRPGERALITARLAK